MQATKMNRKLWRSGTNSAKLAAMQYVTVATTAPLARSTGLGDEVARGVPAGLPARGVLAHLPALECSIAASSTHAQAATAAQ